MNPEQLIATLNLSEHPEGGWFREVFRSSQVVQTPRGERSASTAIYFLLVEGTFSAWHRVKSDEVWHHYAGDPIVLHTISATGHRAITLGSDVAAGQRPQFTVERDVLQAAGVASGWALCGCTVSPGFEFADFEMPDRDVLLREWPGSASIIRELTR